MPGKSTRDVPIRNESIVKSDKCSISKQKKWAEFLAQHFSDASVIHVDIFLNYGLWLIDSGYASSKIYVSAAHSFEKGQIGAKKRIDVTLD